MKHIFLSILLLSIGAVGQDHAFKLNPQGFFNDGFGGSYELYFGNNQSIELSLSTAYLDRFGTNGAIDIIGIDIKYKFFVQKKQTFTGIYYCPVATVISANGSNDFYTVLGVGGLLGYQFIIAEKHKKHGFIFDINAGASNYFVKKNVNPNLEQVSGLQFRYSLSFGYAF